MGSFMFEKHHLDETQEKPKGAPFGGMKKFPTKSYSADNPKGRPFDTSNDCKQRYLIPRQTSHRWRSAWEARMASRLQTLGFKNSGQKVDVTLYILCGLTKKKLVIVIVAHIFY